MSLPPLAATVLLYLSSVSAVLLLLAYLAYYDPLVPAHLSLYDLLVLAHLSVHDLLPDLRSFPQKRYIFFVLVQTV